MSAEQKVNAEVEDTGALFLGSPEMEGFLGSKIPPKPIDTLTPVIKPAELPPGIVLHFSLQSYAVATSASSTNTMNSSELDHNGMNIDNGKKWSTYHDFEKEKQLEDNDMVAEYYQIQQTPPALSQLEDSLAARREMRIIQLEGVSRVRPDSVTYEILTELQVTLSELNKCPNMLAAACSEKGCCRYVQQLLEKRPVNVSAIHDFVYYICDPLSNVSVNDLAKHPYGNHLVQKLVEVCYGRPHSHLNNHTLMNPMMRSATVQLIHIGQYLLESLFATNPEDKCNKMVTLSTNHFASRVVQKILDYRCNDTVDHKKNCFVRRAQLDILNGITATPNDLSSTMCNAFGNYVLQKCVNALHHIGCHAIWGKSRGKCLDYCLNIYGCRVIQQLIARSSSADVLVFIDEISADDAMIVRLCKSNEGNYCMQKLLEYYGDRMDGVLTIIRKEHNLMDICLNKFGSHVIENCLTRPPLTPRIDLFRAILFSQSGLLRKMLLHKYGNYQIQAMMHMCLYDKEVAHFSVALIRGVCDAVSRHEVMKHQWGYYIIAKVDEMMRLYPQAVKKW